MTTTKLAWPAALKPLAFPIGKLTADAGNARVHDERNLRAVQSSLQSFGWRSAIVATRKGKRILAGHGRVAAAKAIGETQVPVAWVDDDDKAAVAFALADNRTAELGAWNNADLQAALADMPDAERNDLGFSAEEWQQLVAPTLPKDWQDEPEQSAAPRPRTEPAAPAAAPKKAVPTVLLLFTAKQNDRFKRAVQRHAEDREDASTTIIRALEALKP